MNSQNNNTNNNINSYIPAIDGLRAIAVLAVLIYHADIFSILKGGFTGVDIFFVISGYVISKSIYERSESSFNSYFLEFYSRRIKRIVPALVICLTITIILSTLFIPNSWLSNTIDNTGLSAFFGLSNFSLLLNHDSYFSPKIEYIPFIHTWSLAIEEQFYLIFPLLFYYWIRYKNSNKIKQILSWTLLIVISIASIIISIYETNIAPSRAFYLLPSRFWEMSIGSILLQFQASSRFTLKSKLIIYILLLTGLILICIGFIYAERTAFPFPWAIPSVVGVLLLLSNIRQPILLKTLGSPIIIYIGKISYSLYLWHWPVAVLMRWTIGFNTTRQIILYFIISFTCAAISYHYIEIPIRKNTTISRQGNWKIIASGISIILISFYTSYTIINFKSDLSLSVTSNNYIWRSRRYHRDIKLIKPENNPNINGHNIFVIGDSHTAAYRTMLNIASAKLGIKIHEYEEGGCAVASLLLPMNKVDNAQTFYKESFSDIKAKAKPRDIVFLASLRMPEIFGEADEAQILKTENSSDAQYNRKLALIEADKIISDFENLGLIVILEAPLPVLKSQPYRCSDWFNKTNPAGELGTTVTKAFLEKLRQPVMDSINTLQIIHPNLYIWDPFVILCKEDIFSAYDKDDQPIFFDSDHLSAHGNRLLEPSFTTKLAEIWDK